MPEPRLLSLGRAVPERSLTQLDLYEHHSPFERNALTDRLIYDSPILTRSLFLLPSAHGGLGLTRANAAWREGALALGERALDDALAAAAMTPDALDLVGVTTVTGYATPGLDLLLARSRGMRSDVHRVHFNCIGCHAAVPLLRVVADHVARRPGTVGVALAVEICSACFSDRPDPQNFVASTLFADGAACAVVGTEGDGPVLVDFGSAFDFEHIDALGFELGSEGFRIVLDPRIPDRIADRIAAVIDDLLARNGLDRSAVALWALHPGGSRILDAAQAALSLPDAAMAPSRWVLRSYGNMSSPTVLFVLAEAMAHAPPPPGSHGVMAAFGPGLGIEVALLRF